MKGTFVVAFALFLAFEAQTLAADGNPNRGQRVFGACAACHSLQPDQNMTGPSLSEVWDRKAGNVASFSRYSSALKSANIEWNDKTLDEWIKDPQHLVPGNEMTFPGIKDAQQRADRVGSRPGRCADPFVGPAKGRVVLCDPLLQEPVHATPTFPIERVPNRG